MFDNSECVVEEQLTNNIVPEIEKRKPNQKPETQYVQINSLSLCLRARLLNS